MTDYECAACTQAISAACAHIFCEHCARPDNTLRYCSALCKDNDRFQHNDYCTWKITMDDDLAAARQAGAIAQELFYKFIEHTWPYDMHSVRVSQGASEDSRLQMHVVHAEKPKPKGPTTCARAAGDWLFKFPSDSFHAFDPAVKEALLGDQNSVWAFVVMNVVVMRLFGDLVDDAGSDIKEVVHYLPGHVSRIVAHTGPSFVESVDRKDLPYPDKDSIGPLKGVYRITLIDGTDIALDLAGAQYSLQNNPSHETVMPWADYVRRWVHDFKYRVPLHCHYDKHHELMQGVQTKTHLKLVTQQAESLTEFLENCDWDLKFRPEELANDEAEQFDTRKQSFMTTAIIAITYHPREFDAELADANHFPKIDKLECLPPVIGSMRHFDWSAMSKLIQMPGHKVRLPEKQRVRELKGMRCVYSTPGDWKLVFLPHHLPSMLVKSEYVSENPEWNRKMK